jgi:hypothetical protein
MENNGKKAVRLSGQPRKRYAEKQDKAKKFKAYIKLR